MRRIAASITLLLLPAICSAADLSAVDYRLVSTSITGAQTQIDSTHSSNWTLTPTANWTLQGGIFVMKAGAPRYRPGNGLAHIALARRRYAAGDYRAARIEVQAARAAGTQPHSSFVQALESKLR